MADRNGTTFLEVSMSFILGTIVGATLALLFAPAPGVETRRMLRDRAEGLRDQAELAAARVRQKVRSAKRLVEEEEEPEEAIES